MKAKEVERYNRYLEQFKISDKKYIIGVFQEGITIYKQQIRALSIFNALVKTKVVRKDSEFVIGIIGGGVAGITFAAAALKAGYKIKIYEQHRDYLHMQYGCSIRKVHPNIYDWPYEGSLFPYADLPILSWRYDTAHNVCKQILKGFEEIKKSIGKPKLDSSFEDLKHFNITKIYWSRSRNKKKNRIRIIGNYEGERTIHRRWCDLLIYATGYGIEDGVTASDSNTPSYWRNDSLDQTILDKTNNKYIISGVGDGGLIDLCRLKIADFNYDSLLTTLKGGSSYNALTDKLKSIREKAIQKGVKNSYFYDEFKELNSNLYEGFSKALNDLIRKDTDVILNSKASNFADCINLKKVCLLNAFLVCLLKNKKAFKYKSGTFETGKGYYTLDGKGYIDRNPIQRHGPNKKAVFDKMCLSEIERKNLEDLQPIQENEINFQSFYDFDEVSKLFKGKRGKEIEYLTTDTEVFFQNFLKVLQETIYGLSKKMNFRISIHRVIHRKGYNYYQQLTKHKKSRHETDQGTEGQIYRDDRGNVGYSIRTGRPLLIINKEKFEYQRLLRQLNIDENYIKKSKVKACLTIPILSKTPDKKGLATNLVLFIDSTDKEFFKINGLIDLIINSLLGFIKSLEAMIGSRKIVMGYLEFTPEKISPLKDKTLLNSSCVHNILNEIPQLSINRTALRFTRFHSFDIINNNFGAFL